MSKRRPSRPPSKAHPAPKKGAPDDTKKKPLWQLSASWLWGIFTAVLIGVLITVISSALSSPAQKHAPLHPKTATAKFPLTILSERPLNTDNLSVWSLRRHVVLSAAQLRRFNIKFTHDTSGTAVGKYLAPLGGYPASSDTQVVVKNNRDYAIRIIDMRVAKSCGAPWRGTLFYAPGQAADLTTELGFNLDSQDTDAKVAKYGVVKNSAPDYFSVYTVSISPGKQQVFDMIAVSSHQACTFNYVATILDGSKKVYQPIEDNNRPFRLGAITSLFSKYGVLYIGGPASLNYAAHGRWVRADPRTYGA